MRLREHAEGSIINASTRERKAHTFAVDPLGIDVGVCGLVECDFVGAIHMFYFENAVAARSPVGV